MAASKLAAPASVTSTTPTPATIQSVAQSYQTTKPLQDGLIVQLDPSQAGSVQAAQYKDTKKILGVVVSPGSAPVSLSSGGSGQQAYVVTSGQYQVLVSNQNGSIAVGDYVSVSAIDGVGMKADTSEAEVLGRAIGNFNGKSNVISTATLKTSQGKQLKVSIGTVLVSVTIAKNPQQTNGQSSVPQFAQRIAVSLVGKEISAAQLYASLAILLAGVGVVASLLYGGIQTGMTAIGRNPLARQSILKNLVQVIVTGLMIFIGCLIGVYLILKI